MPDSFIVGLMSFVKGFFVSVFSLILFFALSLFGLTFTMQQTVLNPEFVAAEVDKLDLASLSRELVATQLNDQLMVMTQDEAINELITKEAIEDIVFKAVDKYEPQIKEQVNGAIYDSYDYLLGNSDHFKIAISLDAIMQGVLQDIKKDVTPIVQQAYPMISPVMVDGLVDQYYDAYFDQGALNMTIDESYLPAETVSQLAEARQVLGYIQAFYYGLIGLIVVLIAAIILIQRNVRKSLRSLGSNLLIVGILEYVALYLGTNYFQWEGLAELPAAIQAWLPQLIADLSAPGEMFAIGVGVVGIIFLIVSFIYRSRVSSEAGA